MKIGLLKYKKYCLLSNKCPSIVKILFYLFSMPACFIYLMSSAFATENKTHLGLPSLEVPADNPMTSSKIALGKKIFFDNRLSADGTISCSSCHQPELGFADGKALAEGVFQRKGTRNAPTVLNAAYNTSQFWDGRRPSLETQSLDPFINPKEHGLPDLNALLQIIRQDSDYQQAFREVFNVSTKEVLPEHVGQALAAFQRTLITGNSPFDRHVFNGEKNAMTPSAKRGWHLFKGAAQCATCHTVGEKDAIFTDNKFHSLNVGWKNLEKVLPLVTSRLTAAKESGDSLDEIILSDEDVAELGYFVVTLKPSDIGKFRTPSLRNVALTAPYMHDGSVATLEDAVEWETYFRSWKSSENPIQPLVLTPREKADLVEFLKSLTSQNATEFVPPAPIQYLH